MRGDRYLCARELGLFDVDGRREGWVEELTRPADLQDGGAEDGQKEQQEVHDGRVRQLQREIRL